MLAGLRRRLLGPQRLSDLEQRITWIWGSPRSGSSWLLQLLADPLEVDLNAPLGFHPPGQGAAPAGVLPIDEFLFASHLVPWDGEPVEVFGEWWPGSINGYSHGRPSYFLSDAYRDVTDPELRRLVLARIEAVVRRARSALPALSSRPAIAIKETPSSHGADRVMDLLPGSRALLLIRDPRDVADSLLHAFQPGGFMATQYDRAFESEQERVAGAEWAAKIWAMSVDVGLAAIGRHDPDLARIVRYEDLIEDAEGELASILDWMEVARSPADIAATVERRSFASLADSGELRRNRSASPGRWRENLSDREAATVTAIAGERLERWGYSA